MKVAINGLGRIGRAILKIALDKRIDVVAVNDLVDTKTLVYLIKHDSVYGNYNKKVTIGRDFLNINGKKIKVFSEKDPSKLPWKKLGVDIVIEATGFFTDRKDAEKHLKAGAEKVIISANSENPDIMIVLGANEDKLKSEHKIISMASCTTNCFAPLAKVLNDVFGIKKGFMTTVHAYTATQGLLDMPNKKLAKGRAAGINIIPTTSGATTATSIVIPELKGKIDGLAFRVPVACGSILDFTVELKKLVSIEQINNSLKKAASGKLQGVMQYTEDDLVSSDIIGNPNSSIINGKSTQVIGNMVKVLSWYDNEWGYSCRIIDLLKMLK